MNKFKIILLVVITLTLYFISLFNFIFNIDKNYITKINVNNIVVLTGNAGRLTVGLMLMDNDIKSRMLITGVAQGVKYSDIIKNKYLRKDRIDLGYNAKNTLGNALEAFGWLKKHNINDIILVTDNWHMQRTLLLFKALMPNKNIYPYTLNSINFTLKDYIQFNKKTFFIYEEHIKYIIAHVQVIYLWLIN